LLGVPVAEDCIDVFVGQIKASEGICRKKICGLQAQGLTMN